MYTGQPWFNILTVYYIELMQVSVRVEANKARFLTRLIYFDSRGCGDVRVN